MYAHRTLRPWPALWLVALFLCAQVSVEGYYVNVHNTGSGEWGRVKLVSRSNSDTMTLAQFIAASGGYLYGVSPNETKSKTMTSAWVYLGIECTSGSNEYTLFGPYQHTADNLPDWDYNSSTGDNLFENDFDPCGTPPGEWKIDIKLTNRSSYDQNYGIDLNADGDYVDPEDLSFTLRPGETFEQTFSFPEKQPINVARWSIDAEGVPQDFTVASIATSNIAWYQDPDPSPGPDITDDPGSHPPPGNTPGEGTSVDWTGKTTIETITKTSTETIVKEIHQGDEKTQGLLASILAKLKEIKDWMTSFFDVEQESASEAYNAATSQKDTLWGATEDSIDAQRQSAATIGTSGDPPAAPEHPWRVVAMGYTFDLDPVSDPGVLAVATWIRSLLYWLLCAVLVVIGWRMFWDAFNSMPKMAAGAIMGNAIPGVAIYNRIKMLFFTAIAISLGVSIWLVFRDQIAALTTHLQTNPFSTIPQAYCYAYHLANSFVPIEEILLAFAFWLAAKIAVYILLAGARFALGSFSPG